jgi:pimeloyl-ACP methyl ester carboxylesterase
MTRTVELAECVTADGLLHQGFVYDPPKRGGTALLFIHGLTGTFYNGIRLHRAFMDACAAAGYGYASFNTRGHDPIAGIRKIDAADPKGYVHVNGGAGYESFPDSVTDLDAGIAFLIGRGYKRVVLVGHSTGANKACYFASVRGSDSRVAGIVLLSPISDRLSGGGMPWLVRLWLSVLVRIGWGERLMLTKRVFFPLTPARALSLLTPKSDEDVFDYGDPDPKLVRFSACRYPRTVILGQTDGLADRPVAEIRATFDRYATAPQYESALIPGADHQFTGREADVARQVLRFVRNLSRSDDPIR